MHRACASDSRCGGCVELHELELRPEMDSSGVARLPRALRGQTRSEQLVVAAMFVVIATGFTETGIIQESAKHA